jgi:hypothetical protein
LALISPPLALSTKTEELLCPPNLIYRTKILSKKLKAMRKHREGLGTRYIDTGMQWKPILCPSPPVPFQSIFGTI